jgi:hypothetical protein
MMIAMMMVMINKHCDVGGDDGTDDGGHGD